MSDAPVFERMREMARDCDTRYEDGCHVNDELAAMADEVERLTIERQGSRNALMTLQRQCDDIAGELEGWATAREDPDDLTDEMPASLRDIARRLRGSETSAKRD